MKVPNYEKAIVPKEKLIDYLLNFDHQDGKSKALFYQKFGYNRTNYRELSEQLKRIISENDFDSCIETAFGKNILFMVI